MYFESSDTTWDGVVPLNVEEVLDTAGVAVDKGGGLVGLPIIAHGFSSSDVIGISGSLNYNGGFTIASETTNEIVITATYVAETFVGDEQVASGMTWDELMVATRSWNQSFQPTSAGQIRAVLKHSADDIDYYDIDYFEVLCAEVEARYLQVEITIIDPTADANLYLKELNILAYTGPQGT